jgi:hypothetical protein
MPLSGGVREQLRYLDAVAIGGTRRRVPLVLRASLRWISHQLRAYDEQILLQGSWLN